MAPISSQRLLLVFGFVSLWLTTEAWLGLCNSQSPLWTAQQKWTRLPCHRKCASSSPATRPRMNPKFRSMQTTKLYYMLSESSLDMMDVSPVLVVVVALGLGVAAQGFINQMLQGDQGLGAYLKDGSGYNKSGFRKVTTSKKEKVVNQDPLPWLKLPQLDFVEVAGQPSRSSPIQEQLVMEELESLRQQLNKLLEQGKVIEASAIRDELESRMKEAGIEYNSN